MQNQRDSILLVSSLCQIQYLYGIPLNCIAHRRGRIGKQTDTHKLYFIACYFHVISTNMHGLHGQSILVYTVFFCDWRICNKRKKVTKIAICLAMEIL